MQKFRRKKNTRKENEENEFKKKTSRMRINATLTTVYISCASL